MSPAGGRLAAENDGTAPERARCPAGQRTTAPSANCSSPIVAVLAQSVMANARSVIDSSLPAEEEFSPDPAGKLST